MKPIIFCLEDFEVHRFILEFKLLELVGEHAEIVYFSSMKQLLADHRKCNLLIADLNLGDSDSLQTAAFLRDFCLHTPVLVQSTENTLPKELESETNGRILATEKAGHGERFSNAIKTFMSEYNKALNQDLPFPTQPSATH